MRFPCALFALSLSHLIYSCSALVTLDFINELTNLTSECTARIETFGIDKRLSALTSKDFNKIYKNTFITEISDPDDIEDVRSLLFAFPHHSPLCI